MISNLTTLKGLLIDARIEKNRRKEVYKKALNDGDIPTIELRKSQLCKQYCYLADLKIRIMDIENRIFIKLKGIEDENAM